MTNYDSKADEFMDSPMMDALEAFNPAKTPAEGRFLLVVGLLSFVGIGLFQLLVESSTWGWPLLGIAAVLAVVLVAGYVAGPIEAARERREAAEFDARYEAARAGAH